MPCVRSLLILGRVSNLPTVWSNCLAAWWLGGATRQQSLPWLIAGASLLYLGGMFLNDAFDAAFDREYRKERPIPAGKISLSAVWIWGTIWLIAGIVCTFIAGIAAGVFGLALTFCILIYDATHKRIAFAPVLMGACRFLLYCVAGSVAAGGLTERIVWPALALGGYVAGISYFARKESTGGSLRHWPLALLVLPVGMALGRVGFEESPMLLSVVLVLWIVRCLRPALWSTERNIGRTVSGLLAGIVLVDWLAAADAPREMGYLFIVLFLMALLLQRFIPAT